MSRWYLVAVERAGGDPICGSVGSFWENRPIVLVHLAAKRATLTIESHRYKRRSGRLNGEILISSDDRRHSLSNCAFDVEFQQINHHRLSSPDSCTATGHVLRLACRSRGPENLEAPRWPGYWLAGWRRGCF